MLVCGIDIGTTNLKVALFDDKGHLVWIKTEASPRVQDRLGVTTDANALVARIEDMVIEGWRATGAKEPVAAISTAGVGEDGIYVDAALNPLGHSIPWFDQRAAKESAELQSHEAATPRSGISMDSTRTAAKWLWIARNAKAEVSRAYAWISLTDYPLARWANKAFISDTLAARTGCFDSTRRTWIEGLLLASGAGPMPEVLCAGTAVGTVQSARFLQSGAVNVRTVLVAGGHDHPAAAHAIHRIDPLARVDSLGTANVIYGDAPTFEVTAFDPYIAFMASIEGPSKLACLGVFEFSNTVKQHAGGMDAIRKMLALPRIPGAPNTENAVDATDVRGLLEWATMNARVLLERLDGYGVPKGPIFATGGWSRSNALLELRASVFGQPIHAPEEKELTVLGAALFAASCVGAFQTFDAPVRVVEPDLEWHRRYQDLYGEFVRTTNALGTHS